MLYATDSEGVVRVAFTDRHGGVTPGVRGSLNLGRTDDDPQSAAENFGRVSERLGLARVVTMHQVHSADVHLLEPAAARAWPERGHLGSSVDGGTSLPRVDAIVTTRRAADSGTARPLALCVRVADCLPVLLADPVAGVLAAVHAGRVGLLAGVLPRAVAEMRRHGARRLTAWIGPHVCGSCYEVPAPMRQQAVELLPQLSAETSWRTPALDLGAGARAQLETAGVAVRLVGGCTRTDPRLHSFRRDGADSGRQAGLVWLT